MEPRWLAAAIALAVSAEGLTEWLAVRDAAAGRKVAPGPVLWPGLGAQDGKPLPFRNVHPQELGVHASRFSADGDSPYIPPSG